MREIYVFGHKHPDTDSVCAAIAFSNLKRKIGMNAIPKILGKINNETKYVLNYFNIPVPDYLEDVKLQIKDLNYYKDCFVHDTDSIRKTYDYMIEKNITGVPIVNNNNKLIGLLTSKIIGSELINGDFTKLNTSYNNIIEVLNGEEILKFDDEIKGNIIAASYRSTTFLNTLELNKNTIMIVGDRHSLIEAAVNNKIKLLVVVGNQEIKTEHIEIARVNKVNIIKTGLDTFHTAKLINLANYCKNLLTDSRNVSFYDYNYYDDFKEKSIKLGYNNYPVINNKNVCLGLIRITDINKLDKKQVILVDHNEADQSVDGLDEAEILEIIDHHKIGDLTTNMPINFRNMTVGSSCSIIYSLYRENSVDISPSMAGLMLSGILSDTLKFTSPTTTEYDKYIASILASIADINIEEFSRKMFKAGTNLKGKSLEQILDGDLKLYKENGKNIAIAQVVTLNSDEILDQKDKYIDKINELKNNRMYDIFILCVTDIINKGSYIFYNNESYDMLCDAIESNIYEGYFIDGMLSRKKQLVPLVINAIK